MRLFPFAFALVFAFQRPQIPVPKNRFEVYGDVVVPKSATDWATVTVKLPDKIKTSNVVVLFDNFTHPSPTKERNGEQNWLRYDVSSPLVFCPNGCYLIFMAHSGDHIFYQVGMK